MKLPKLPDVVNLDEEEKSTEIINDNQVENTDITSKVEFTDEKSEPVADNDNKLKKGGEEKKERPKIPKSKYDSDGNPILMIPDIDDVELISEIDKYFG